MSDSGSNSGDRRLYATNSLLTRSSSRSASSQSSQEDLSVGGASVKHQLLSQDVCGAVRIEESADEKHDGGNSATFECAICLQPCIHPVKLPCSHVFCFLCAKGVAFQSRRCAMCRQEIPIDFLFHPQLVDRSQLEKESALEDGYQWFYEGRNGWWQYDERTTCELENAYKRSQRVCELLIAGFLYTVDFDQMLQYRKHEPSRRRRIKRDLASTAKKGIAGLRLDHNEEGDGAASASPANLLSVAASRAAVNPNCLSPSQTPQAPSNTPQTPQTPRSPPSPAPLENGGSDSESGSEVVSDIEERWQERERRRLRHAVEEIERLRLHDGEPHHVNLHQPPRLDNMVIYYNLDEATGGVFGDNPYLLPSEDSSSDDERSAS